MHSAATMTPVGPKERFSNRVEEYVRYRPGYPQAIVELLRQACGLAPESVVADVGCGTGLLARLFIENGNTVWGVEPNAAMRQAGERLLQGQARFRSVAGSAEETTLPAASADFIVAGQSFHWFDAQAARGEFARVLRPGGWVAVIWNERQTNASPFLRSYETLLRDFGTDYAEVAANYPRTRQMEEFFGPGAFQQRVFHNEQILDWEGLRGRLLSSSYSPPRGDSRHEPMLAELENIFLVHAENGRVRVAYDTRVYYGRLAAGGAEAGVR